MLQVGQYNLPLTLIHSRLPCPDFQNIDLRNVLLQDLQYGFLGISNDYDYGFISYTIRRTL